MSISLLSIRCHPAIREGMTFTSRLAYSTLKRNNIWTSCRSSILRLMSSVRVECAFPVFQLDLFQTRRQNPDRGGYIRSLPPVQELIRASYQSESWSQRVNIQMDM